jgi:hypothetical protein
MHTDEKVEPLKLTLKEGTWADAVSLEVKNEKGEALRWPFHLAPAGAETLALDAETTGALDWWLTAEETAQIAEGTYKVVGVLDTRAAAAEGAWKGIVRSPSVAVRINKEPASPGVQQQEEKYLLLANLAHLRGDARQATARIDELLAKQPRSLAGLAFKVELLADAGKTEAALELVELAIGTFFSKYPDAQEPPFELLHTQQLLEEKLRQQNR